MKANAEKTTLNWRVHQIPGMRKSLDEMRKRLKKGGVHDVMKVLRLQCTNTFVGGSDVSFTVAGGSGGSGGKASSANDQKVGILASLLALAAVRLGGA